MAIVLFAGMIFTFRNYKKKSNNRFNCFFSFPSFFSSPSLFFFKENHRTQILRTHVLLAGEVSIENA